MVLMRVTFMDSGKVYLVWVLSYSTMETTSINSWGTYYKQYKKHVKTVNLGMGDVDRCDTGMVAQLKTVTLCEFLI